MVISRTPLRISFAGGGTDIKSFYELDGGAVVSSAIDKYIYVIVKERFDRKIYINYSKKEIVDSIDAIQHDLVRETMRMTGVEHGVEITTLADIPSEGTGLGSSSSVTVGLLNALYTYKGEAKPASRIAEEACEIEIDRIGKPIGKQDQYITAFGGIRYFRFAKTGQVETEPIDLEPDAKRAFSKNLMLFYSNRIRQSDPILREQVAHTNDRRGTLNSIKKLAEDARLALRTGNLEAIGTLLHEGWEYKKKLAEQISDDHIDEMYSAALSAGALGGKICGAGGGGFLLLYCEPVYQAQVKEALSRYAELPFTLERYGTSIIFNIAR
ncbi:MAG: GHMP kinase [Candidatus Glassbacteria bacterium]